MTRKRRPRWVCNDCNRLMQEWESHMSTGQVGMAHNWLEHVTPSLSCPETTRRATVRMR